jgi:hypothetical protein
MKNIDQISKIKNLMNVLSETKKINKAEILKRNLLKSGFELSPDKTTPQYSVFFNQKQTTFSTNTFVIIPTAGDYSSVSMWWSGVDAALKFFTNHTKAFKPLWTKKITIMTNWDDEFNDVVKILSILGSPTPRIQSLIGYSMGGYRMWPYMGKFPFTGLMDPYTTADNYKNAQGLSGGKNFALYYTKNFWEADFGKYVTDSKHLPICASYINSPTGAELLKGPPKEKYDFNTTLNNANANLDPIQIAKRVQEKKYPSKGRGQFGATYLSNVYHWYVPNSFVPDYMNYF